MHFREFCSLTFRRFGQRYGLTELEIRIIIFLYENPEYNTSRDICEMNNLAKSNVSNAVRHLERLGLVRITIDPDNRKIHRLYLTDKSDSAARTLYEAQEDSIRLIMEGITEEEKDAALDFCKKVDSNICEAVRKMKEADGE